MAGDSQVTRVVVSEQITRVLLIEDDIADATLARAYLDKQGEYCLYHVQTIEQALEAISNSKFDAIVSDLRLPSCDGLDSVKRILSVSPTTPIVVLSGSDDRELGIEAVRAGAQDYLVKGRVLGPHLDEAIRHAIERKRQELYFAHLASTDPLTGLPNRSQLEDKINKAASSWRRNGNIFGVLLIDLDRFKYINDTLGHEAGDVLLCEVANRLNITKRSQDTAARIGGDEFAVLVEGIENRAGAAGAARRILAALSAPIDLNGHEVNVRASIGVAVCPDGGESYQRLMKSADVAMYESKKAGRNTYRIYDEQNDRRISLKVQFDAELAQSLNNGELELFYQPVVDLSTGTFRSIESLLRWNRKNHKQILPGEFMPSLEDSGLIVEVAGWGIRTACRQLAQLKSNGQPYERVSVNISKRQFLDPGFLDLVSTITKEPSFHAGMLELEFKENTLVEDIQSSLDILNQLKNMGIRVVIDDFGTGYSSLSSLCQLPVDAVKIDKECVAQFKQDRKISQIIDAIIVLGSSLNIEVICEGIETEVQLRYLVNKGCLLHQGYYISRPMSASQISASTNNLCGSIQDIRANASN